MGGDVLQAIDWAQSRVPDQGTYAVALLRDRPGPTDPERGSERGLVWLVGIDGNTTSGKPTENEALRRMEKRRVDPVVIPPGDRVGI